METILIKRLDGSDDALLSEKEVKEYLKNSLKECPFCGSEDLLKDRYYSHIAVHCRSCEFRLSSFDLHMNSRVKKEMKDVAEVLSEPIQKEVNKHEEKIRDKLVTLTLAISNLTNALNAHRIYRSKPKSEKQ